MGKKIAAIVSFLIFPIFSFAQEIKPPALPSLVIKKNSISISGISAGAFMSVQMGVAYSNTFSGVGSFAGGIYNCSEGSLVNAQIRCMSFPDQIKVDDFLTLIKKAEAEEKIDSVSNLVNQKIFVFSGSKDAVVRPTAGAKLAELYNKAGNTNGVTLVNDFPAGHGQPTLNYGVNCQSPMKPWILNCDYDGAKAVLESIYGSLNESKSIETENLKKFDQTLYANKDALMGLEGSIYIPKQCQSKVQPCRLHVALHGCQQSPDWIGDEYQVKAGYNEWAEANNIIVLYPSVRKSEKNPNACWDWWGYTGTDFANREGLQMKALRSMIRALSGY